MVKNALHLLVAYACLLLSTEASSTLVATLQATPVDNRWRAVTWSTGFLGLLEQQFVAVASTGTGNRVMTSPDGTTWSIRTTPPAADNYWSAVTSGNELFVAVASSGSGNRVMTSPDGIAWTIRTSAADNDWSAVTYGNGLFVAVASTGTGNRVMTSPDGTTWTIRTSAADNSWSAVTYGNGLFVAVASSGTGDRVMTSPDGIAWTIRTSAADNRWSSVTYGTALNQTDLEQSMGVFVAVAWMGSDRVMTSPDGITWTTRTQAADSMWYSVTYGLGLFVAVSKEGSAEVMTSPDGTTWTIGPSSPEQKAWSGVTFGTDPKDGTAYAVAVADQGTAGNRVMTLSSSLPSPQYTNAGRTSKVLGCFAVSTGICMTAWLIATVTSI